MANTPTQTQTAKAKTRPMSLYDLHWEYLKRKAQELTKKTGRYVSASQVNQELIEKDMRRSAQ